MTLTASVLLDIVLLAVLLLGFVQGVRRGFILTLCSLLAVVIGLAGGWFLALYGTEQAAPALLPLLTDLRLPQEAALLVVRVLLFLGGFVVVQLLWTLLCHALHLVAKLPGLHFLNKVLGGLLGLLKNTILLLLALWILRDLLAWIPPEVADASQILALLDAIPLPTLSQ